MNYSKSHFCLPTSSMPPPDSDWTAAVATMLSLKCTLIKTQIPSKHFKKYSLIHLCLECITHVSIEDITGLLKFKRPEMAGVVLQGVTSDGLMWPGLAWFILLSCSTVLEMMLTFLYLFLGLSLKNSKKRKTFNCLLVKSRLVLFKKLLIPYSLITSQHKDMTEALSIDFIYNPWRKIHLLFSLHTEDKFAKGNIWQYLRCSLFGDVDNATLFLDHVSFHNIVTFM